MPIKIANAPCSWGVDYADSKDNPGWEKVIKEISDAGYYYSELGPFGYLPKDAEQIKSYIENLNIKIIGGFIYDNLHDSIQHASIRDKIIHTCKLLNKLGSKVFIIMDHLSNERMKNSGNPSASPKLDLNEYKILVNFLKDISKICYENYGLKPAIHPHAGTYIEYQDELDNLLNDINYNYLGVCLDTAHLHYCGVDPYKAIEKYSTLIDHMHFKDVNQSVLDMVYKNRLDFITAVKKQVFCPLGKGIINFERVIQLLNGINYNEYATIEQDIDPSEGLNPLDYAKKSLSYLKGLGLK